MRKINLLLVALVGATTFSLTSCTDECKDVVCNNGGTCAEGVCECADNYFGEACDVECVNGTFSGTACDCEAGFEGDACTIESREDMISSYNVTDNCSASGQDTYEVGVTAGSASADVIRISNFWAIFVNSVEATVDGDNITITEQEPDADGWKVSGSGTFNADAGTMSWNYSVIDPDGNVDACTATWTKL